MKVLRMIGMVVMTILMSVFSVSCSSDDDDENTAEIASIVGSWTCPIDRTWADTEILEFKSNGTFMETLYDKTTAVLEEKGTYVYAKGKLTFKREGRRELLDNGKWSSWEKKDDTEVFEVTIKDNKLTLTDNGYVLVYVRK